MPSGGGYLYLDSAPDDWETRIRESGYECVWAMHDKDVRPTGEIKETHVHVAVRFSHAVDVAAAKELLSSFGVKEPSVQYRDSWRAVCRYMVHMDDPDKYQYDPNIVCECGGADWKLRFTGQATNTGQSPRCRTGAMPMRTADLTVVRLNLTTS